MTAAKGTGRIPLQVSRGSVVASIQVDLNDDVLALFQQELLRVVHRSEAHGVILDLSGVDLMDRQDFESLRRTMSMAALMGARCLMAGLKPGVVSALMDIGIDAGEIEAVRNLDEAFRILEREDELCADAEDVEANGLDGSLEVEEEPQDEE